jgi:hypothetical protein
MSNRQALVNAWQVAMLLRFYEIGVHSLVRNTALLAKPDA